MTTRPPHSPRQPPSLPAFSPWTTQIALRMRRHFLLKLLGTTAFVSAFFMGYFHLLRHPAYPVTLMPLTVLDGLIPFQPSALFAYLSLWFYLGLGPGLQLTFRELMVYTLWASTLSVTGLALFYFWPTAVPPLGFDVSEHPGFRMLQGVDASGNACPSMHVAIAIFTVIRLEHLLRGLGAPPALRVVNLAWFLAIAWSTLAIRQHVVLDVLGGALLGTVFAVASLQCKRIARPQQALRPQPMSPTASRTDAAP